MQFYPVYNFGECISLGLGTVGIERVTLFLLAVLLLQMQETFKEGYTHRKRGTYLTYCFSLMGFEGSVSIEHMDQFHSISAETIVPSGLDFQI